MGKPAILFLCTGNSCRSQMAEGWGKALLGDRFEIYSAGIEAHGLNPHACEVMLEAGIDIGNQQSTPIGKLDHIRFDTIVTVCDHAHCNRPELGYQPRILHIPFDDPPRLAQSATTEEEALSHYRRVRDEIRAMVEGLPQRMNIG